MITSRLVTRHAISKVSRLNRIESIQTTKFPTRLLHNQTKSTQKPLPRLIYLSNPIKHCLAKVNMKILKLTWDPEFCEQDFKKGACRAVLKMTDLVRKGDILTMQTVTTRKGFEQISKDSVLSADDPRLNLLRFRDEDIKKMHPLSVHFVQRNGTNHLYIDMFFAMLRPVDCMVAHSNTSLLLDVKKIEDDIRKTGVNNIPDEDQDPRRLVLAEIFTRFHREYKRTEHIPTWDIEFYKVAKMKIIYAKN